ncbi:hypothetical protein G6F70_002950 [Rhizopus microsporus]|nr:hypothetical protein G6F71_000132 [Rhizopus microsporus]KAG1201658.1 hypothetical protein G6F70_002950 [Rhizopus microsporus]KAG1213662.1 hypothetical protein G6F69_002627 [Rhizopus microsporus]KAG1238450.1 hypothetical protein G6F67_000434 [Rhizopus microsporus]KAG1265095.1 hypothetical protein G6F68_003868 [Rhizopus microsporus]
MPNKTFEFSNDEINSIDVNENNKFLATADDDGNVNIIDLGSDKLYKKTTKKHQTICMTTKFRPKKSWDVWSGGMDSKVYEWDFSRGLPTNIYDMNPEEPTAAQMFNPPFVYSLDITNDGKWVAASLGDTTIQMISPPSKKVKSTSKIRLINGHNTMVNCMSFIETPNQSASLISGAANGGLAIWTGFYNCTSTTLEPAQTFQVDTATMQKVNWLKAYHKDDQLHVAIAGVGPTPESVIGNKWDNYLSLLQAEYTEGEALDALGLKRYCCRRMVLTHVDLIEKLLHYNPLERTRDRGRS